MVHIQHILARHVQPLRAVLSAFYDFPFDVDEHPDGPDPSSHELRNFQPEDDEGPFSLSKERRASLSHICWISCDYPSSVMAQSSKISAFNLGFAIVTSIIISENS